MTRRASPSRDWPGLMRARTARAYLDDMSEAVFGAEVEPHLERRLAGGEIHYTRQSIDDWIDRGGRAGNPRTAADMMAMISDDGDPSEVPLPARRRPRREPSRAT